MKKFLLIALAVFLLGGLSGCIGNDGNDNGDNNGDNDMTEKFTQIGTTTDMFFWALQSFGGKLYAGTYGTPKAYNYPPWKFLKNFAAGESIADFEVFKNRLYAASEKKGYLYRMNTPTDWVRVHEDSYIYALNLAVFGDYLYCLYATPSSPRKEKIIRSSDGVNWTTVWTSSNWCRHFVVYKGELYLVGSAGGYSRAVKTSNGTHWVNVPKLADVFQGEWFSPVAWNGKLWLSTGGNVCKARIYKFDGTNLTEVFRNEDVYEVYCLHIYNNEIYALLQPGWKKPGTSYLYKSPTGESGTWTLLKSFPGIPWARSIETFNNELYIGIGRTVYKMSMVPVAETLSEKTIGCPTCGSTAKVTISSIAERNAKVLCPVCEAPLPERAVKVELIAEGELIKELRGRIEALDERKVELEKEIPLVRIQIEEVKELMGL